MRQPLWKSMIVAVLFLGGGAGCRSWDAGNATPTSEVSEVITQEAPPSARAFEQRAWEAARRWRPDAYMTRVTVLIPATRPDGTFTLQDKVSFFFMSKVDVDHWYAVDFNSAGTLGDFEFPGQAAGSEVVPIESSDWPLDSTDAWRIGQAAGGKPMLQKYEAETEDMRCSISLERWNPSYTGRVVWRGLCMDAVTLRSFDFRIDAQTGEVVEKTAE